MKELVSKNIINEYTRIGISHIINELSYEFNEASAETFNITHLSSAKEVVEKVIEIVKKMELKQYILY